MSEAFETQHLFGQVLETLNKNHEIAVETHGKICELSVEVGTLRDRVGNQNGRVDKLETLTRAIDVRCAERRGLHAGSETANQQWRRVFIPVLKYAAVGGLILAGEHFSPIGTALKPIIKALSGG